MSRKQAETELTPITEEFIFSTKRPKRPRPKTKAASSTLTAAPTSAASSSTHPSTTTPTPTVAFPTPALLPTPEPTTVRPYRPVFTTPNRKIVSSAATKSPKPPPTRTTATTLTTPPLKNRKVTEPIPVSEAQMTGMQPSTRGYTRGPQMHTTGVTAGTTSGEHMVNYKGITMSEDEFLKQLVRIVEAHQVAINKIEEQRIEAQRKAEEERRIEEQLAAREVENQSTVVNPAFGMHIPGETQAGEHSTDYYGYSTNSDATKTVLAGLMSMSSRLTSTEPPQLEIIHFTAPPPTPSSPANEWVTSPHSWRPPPDMQTNVLEWSRTPIPSTGTSELPSTVTSECDSNVECAFSYEDDLLCPHPNDATRYLQCTPMIGRRGRWTERMCPPNLVFIPSYGRCGLNVGATPDPYATQSFVIPRLPSDPEYVHWQGNKELQPHVAQLPYQPIVTLAPYQPVLQTTTLTPILRTIDEFPRDLLPPFSYIHNTIPPSQFEPDQDPNMDLSVINPLFPRVQPDFLMPFGKFRDGFVSSGNSFMGSIIKPAIKKVNL
ncbi:hypothetical protein ANCCEY_04798 [Ancylostoma ceylanicum]|uniref:Chitin-binding type-2 domain-containing protein n=1 Tax=Ancylostoma ceylanicum TaxID=53326 RepID=A0A0D6M8C4_9BILA|nr:hypothetical protein ANCCEY_04798 [Ancylostoma ceylanicum]